MSKEVNVSINLKSNIQKGIAESLNTNVITLGETVGDLYAAGQAVGIDSGQIGEMVKGFQDAGIQTGNIKENIQLSVDIARKVGVNTSAVFELVRNNLSNINKYGFENGVAGLAKMSAQAASLRIGMNEIFNFAEKVFNQQFIGGADYLAAIVFISSLELYLVGYWVTLFSLLGILHIASSANLKVAVPLIPFMLASWCLVFSFSN